MDDLISRTVLIDELMAGCMPLDLPGLSGVTGDELTIRNYIDSTPAVDAAPVVHAQPIWINPLNHEANMCTWKCSSLCSACGDYVATSWNYCPNCGAKMDE